MPLSESLNKLKLSAKHSVMSKSAIAAEAEKAAYYRDQKAFVEESTRKALEYSRTHGTRNYADDSALLQRYSAPAKSSWRDRWASAGKKSTREQSPAQSVGGYSPYAQQGDFLSPQNSYAGWDQAAQSAYGLYPSFAAPSAQSGTAPSIPPTSSPSLAQQPQQGSSQPATTDASKQDPSTNNTVSGV